MSATLIPLISPSGAPWQLPLPGTLSPLSAFDVSNPSSLATPPLSGGNYAMVQDNTYQITASMAASLGFAAYFQGKATASAQYFLSEYLHYNTVPLPSGFDPEGVTQNLYVGYGYRIVLAFCSAQATASSSISQFSAQVEVNGAALYANFQSLGFNPGSTLDLDASAIANTFTAGSTFNVDSYVKFQSAVTQFTTDLSDAKNSGSISPVLVGADVNQSAMAQLCNLDYPASVAYALEQITKNKTADAAASAIAQMKIPPTTPPITLDPGTVYAIYALVLGTSDTSTAPNKAQSGLANSIRNIGS